MKHLFAIAFFFMAITFIVVAVLFTGSSETIFDLTDSEVWTAKFLFLIVMAGFLFLKLMSNFEKNKMYIPYVLAFCISMTGFTYSIQPGYQTSANEVLTVMLLLIWVAKRKTAGGNSATPVYFSRQLRIFFLISAVGFVTAFFLFEVSPMNIFITSKSYLLYPFYLFLIPACVRSEKELKNVVFFIFLMSLYPLYYGITGGSAIEDVVTERLSMASWGPLNIFVGYILPILFIAIGLLLDEKAKWQKGLFIVYAVLILYVIVLAQTRTAWASLIVGAGIFLALMKRRFAVMIVATVLAAGLIFSPAGEKAEQIIEHRIMEQTMDPDTSLENRYGRWGGAWATAKTYPFTGSGWGGVLPLISDNEVGDISLDFPPLWHNSYLELLSQLGFPGMLAFIFLWWKIINTERKKLLQTAGLKYSTLQIGFFTAVVACLLYALGEQQFYRIETASHTYFVAGLLLAARNVLGIKNESFQNKTTIAPQ